MRQKNPKDNEKIFCFHRENSGSLGTGVDAEGEEQSETAGIKRGEV